ncbi:MAG TPA: enoyl-CoA hydratase-related protein [Rhodococcus sp. (in: high G+C Gram-positive bacteria)]|uniref:enoyl-CoA hydratase/isomerase family protein n=1 Tax=Rhodococcus sp. SMB37 TaxID=2512213 RepID=UPI001048CB2E|nr:enoyl-CoA hydratase-related protein [Rhodococcus sp. SMB37]TCN49788.1 2-(1,2-epoxy-1,2-dihydrophenyl)acetyl-CoA isomerase [Rhodococcus sp. SMB37]HET8993436.1 enoyl-CoA hydratase-related protein [Rhodococcus sp. (in: high G+C Gram-positive bacteria)]
MPDNAVSPDGPLLADLHAGILTLTLNRPERKNAITPEMWARLRDRLLDATVDNGVRAVVLTGAGATFCSGADIADTAGMDEFPDPSDLISTINDTIRLLQELPVPTVAKVSGVAAGAGWNLALACDLVVAASDARFCQIFARRALSLDTGGSWLLPRLVGLQQAKRLALLADMIGADEAQSLGLVTWVTAPVSLDEFTHGIAERLASGPPLALAQTKDLLNRGLDRSLTEALEYESQAQAANLQGPDILEAFAAFSDKRDPDYTRAAAAR